MRSLDHFCSRVDHAIILLKVSLNYLNCLQCCLIAVVRHLQKASRLNLMAVSPFFAKMAAQCPYLQHADDFFAGLISRWPVRSYFLSADYFAANFSKSKPPTAYQNAGQNQWNLEQRRKLDFQSVSCQTQRPTTTADLIDLIIRECLQKSMFVTSVRCWQYFTVMAVGDKREKLAHRLLIDHLSRVCSWMHLHSKKFAYCVSFAFFTCLPALYIQIIL